MNVQTALRSLLINDGGVSALVSARVYWVHAPQEQARPFVTFDRIDGTYTRTLSGTGCICRARYQFDCFADDMDSAAAAGAAVEIVLDGYSGTSEGVEIKRISLDSDQDIFEGEQVRLYRRVMDFIVIYKR